MKKVIFNLIVEHHGNWTKIYDAILNKEKSSLILNMEDWSEMYENSVFISEENYFDKFKKMYMPPFALFYKGNANLINERVLGILGDIQNIDIKELRKFKDSGYVICISQNNLNSDIINELMADNFKLIILCNKKIDYFNVKINNNVVYLSEYCTNKINIDKQQFVERLIYSISDDIFIDSKIDNNINLALEFYINEPKSCFMIIEEDKISKISNKNIFNSIKYLSEIINFNKT